MIVIIDNYDSFTYNLVHLVARYAMQPRGAPAGSTGSRSAASADSPVEYSDGAIGTVVTERNVEVFRNDRVSVREIAEMHPSGILISPGPGRPEDAGITCSVIRELGESIPILGVCLGHQAIGEVFGGTVTYAPSLMHGKTSLIHHDGQTIFQGLTQDFVATRYHSLVVDRTGLPSALAVSASTPDGVIMGLRHTSWPLEGIQFHPESLLTTEGPALISNWVASLARED